MAIAPKSGKTLAYLCPLLTSLTDQRLYKEIATGNGVGLLQSCSQKDMNPSLKPDYFIFKGNF